MIALYARSSTERQSKGLDAQIVALQEFCRSRGFKESEIKLYQDFGISGAKKSRPALDSLIADMQQGSITSIYVYSISRLSRSLKDLLELMNQFENHAVEFESLTEAFNLKSPFGRLLVSILGSLAQMEREILSERTKNGLKAARTRGKVLGAKRIYDQKLIQKLHSEGPKNRFQCNTRNNKLS